MSNQWSTMNGRTSKRGLFVGGIWHCDCQPRLPAEKFQVKDASKKNFGRWFFTCQKPQPKRCPFFLWADDAKIREEAAVLSNSKNEPTTQIPPQAPPQHIPVPAKVPDAPRTPMRQMKIKSAYQVNKSENAATPTTKSKFETTTSRNHDESYDWSSSADEELAEVANVVESGIKSRSLQEQSSRKLSKPIEIVSPSKRKHSDMSQGTVVGDSDDEYDEKWPVEHEDIFMTPSTSTKSHHNSFDVPSPLPKTPVNVRRQLFAESEPPRLGDSKSIGLDAMASPLALEALNILSPLNCLLSPTVKNDLVSFLNRHDLRMQGVTKGREIARLAVKAKEGKIVELQQRVTALEAEKETCRVVIQHLKTDIANHSPRKVRRSRGEDSRR